MKFTAIDFETANSSRSSACAVGLTRVANGDIVGEDYFLVRPVPCHFEPINVSIHGITEADVADAPTFRELWPRILDSIDGPLVAHNAAFDMSVLRYALDESGIDYPSLHYFCTLVISRLAWRDQDRYTLSHLSELLGIQLRHHNAAADAYACAKIALSACQICGVSDLSELEEAASLRTGALFPGGYTPCGIKRR